jgi:pyrimidine operon attenuation protein/uracil phosphoribosyltransferase
MSERILLNDSEVDLALHRLTHQLIENHGDFSNSILIGLQPRGICLTERLSEMLKNAGVENVRSGSLDITFFRDDFRRREEPISANKTNIPFVVENQNVIFVDDVLFTGRSVRAALDAINSFGRPSKVELLVLVDRRLSRHLPIQPNYIGRTVDSVASERVVVNWKEENGSDNVELLSEVR